MPNSTSRETRQRIARYVMPGQEQSDGQRGQQEILTEAQLIEPAPQPDAYRCCAGHGPSARARPFVQAQQRQNKCQADQRTPRLSQVLDTSERPPATSGYVARERFAASRLPPVEDAIVR